MRKGFTLVELSIVLVIIGLLVGGILVAQSMIDSVRTSMVVREYKQYEIALRLFKDRFRAFPGDFSRADVVLGAAFAGNGNGATEFTEVNGVIDGEMYSAFNHMYLSGVLKEPYAGNIAYSSGRGWLDPGNTAGISGYDNGRPTGWTFIGTPTGGSYTNWNANWSNSSENVGAPALRLTGCLDTVQGSGDPHCWRGPFTPANAMAVDKKLDDGVPGQGAVTTHGRNSYTFRGESGLAECTTSDGLTWGADAQTARYWVEQDYDECPLLFWLHDFN